MVLVAPEIGVIPEPDDAYHCNVRPFTVGTKVGNESVVAYEVPQAADKAVAEMVPMDGVPLQFGYWMVSTWLLTQPLRLVY